MSSPLVTSFAALRVLPLFGIMATTGNGAKATSLTRLLH